MQNGGGPNDDTSRTLLLILSPGDFGRFRRFGLDAEVSLCLRPLSLSDSEELERFLVPSISAAVLPSSDALDFTKFSLVLSRSFVVMIISDDRLLLVLVSSVNLER